MFPKNVTVQILYSLYYFIFTLAADDHMKEVIQQLQLMGEVIYVKGMGTLSLHHHQNKTIFQMLLKCKTNL